MQKREPASRPAPKMGPTGRAVATNVRNLRIEREMTLQQVSEATQDSPAPLSLDALSKLENGLRRVDVDDLAVLSVVLDVSVQELVHGNRETRARGRLRELSAREAELAALEQFLLSRRKHVEEDIAHAEAEIDPSNLTFESFTADRWGDVTQDLPLDDHRPKGAK